MPEIIKAFFFTDDGTNTTDTSLFEYYLDGLFQQSGQVNPVLAGYFEKIFQVLV
jgi:hypothetical protein